CNAQWKSRPGCNKQNKERIASRFQDNREKMTGNNEEKLGGQSKADEKKASDLVE
ncbi:hypothetical protein Trydic_g6983, partial [Trypoxylus dichotomus]